MSAESHFAPFLRALLAPLSPTNAGELPVPPEFARLENSSAQAVMVTRRHALPHGAELRVAHLLTPRAELLNILALPTAAAAAPLFALEILRLGSHSALAVVDLKALDPVAVEPARAALRAVHATHPELTDAGDAPAWYAETRSGDDFYLRPADQLAIDRALAAALAVWRAELDLLASAPPAIDPTGFAAALRHYKEHHRQHQPGRPFLHRLAGADWTERYFSSVLYG
jgi:hypothetical protein